MIKKLSITLIILMLSTLLTSCGNSNVVPENINSLIPYFGQDKSKIFEAMNLTEEEARDNSELLREDSFTLPLKERQMILGDEMIASILILNDEKTVWGMEYFNIDTDIESSLKLAKKIEKKLTATYEVDLGYTAKPISDVTSSEILTEMSGFYGTHWVYKDDIDVGLIVNIVADPESDSEMQILLQLRFVKVNREE